MLKEMNKALDYIETNLDQHINLSEVARIAHCSEYHFKRLFSILSGYTLSEYIRNRRLTMAALELKQLNLKVIDIAQKYGYQSPDAFTRAFQQFHSVTPSDARNLNQQLRAFPRLSFQLIIQGGLDMKYHIIEKEAFSIVGMKYRVQLKDNELTPSYEEMVSSISEEKMIQFHNASKESNPSGIVHVTSNQQDTDEGAFTFNQYIGYVSKGNKTEGLSSLDISAGTWAVFEVEGDWEEVEKHWMQIYTEWLPSSNYEYDQRPEMLTSLEERNQIWIPII